MIASILWLSVSPLLLPGQEKIESDRPTESLSSTVVGKGTFQVEAGLRKDQQNGSDYSIRQPDIQWRYGLLNRLKFRISTTSETQLFFPKTK